MSRHTSTAGEATGRPALVRDDETAFERAALAVTLVAVALVVAALATLLQWLPLDASVAGASSSRLAGATVFALGLATAGFGLASRAGLVDTAPDHGAGVPTGLALGTLAFATGGLVASQTIGLSRPGLLWFLCTGALATAAVAGPAFAAGLGVVDWVAARADLGTRGTAAGGVALLAAGGLAVAALASGAGGVLPALIVVVGPVVGVPAVLDSRVRSRGALLRAGIGGLLALGAIGGGALWATGSGALVGWSGPAVALGAIGAAATLLPREDVGSTLTTGAFAAFVGLVLLAGAIDPGWAWDVTNIPETASTNAGAGGGVTGQIAVPGLVAVAALLVAWAGAKSYGGYGAEGRERGAFVLLYLNAAAILAAMGLVVGFVVYRGAGPALRGAELHWDSVSIRELGLSIPHPNVRWPFVELGYSFVPEIPNGILPPLVGTFWIVLGAVLLGVPLALGAAVYLSEFAEQAWFTRLVETATNALWSTPSVVYGLFAFSFIVLELGISQSIFAGQLVLAFMLIPLVLITSREAIVAVPDEYRDASAALGVTQWQTIRSVVLPAAMPGILTGVILGVGRIAGETAPILLVVSSRLSAREAPNVLGSFRLVGHPPFVTNDALLSSSGALPLRIWTIISHGVAGPMEQGWGAAFVLLLLVLGFYAVGIAMRTYFRRKLTHD